jgi:hypothetical protein
MYSTLSRAVPGMTRSATLPVRSASAPALSSYALRTSVESLLIDATTLVSAPGLVTTPI